MITKYTTAQVGHIVENEGLDYAILHYMSGDRILDPELARLWEEARLVLNEIDHRINDALADEPDEETECDELRWTKEDILADIAKLNQELADNFEQDGPIRNLATLLHEKQCSSSHIDGCSWSYEDWNNMGNSRKRYFDKATNLLLWAEAMKLSSEDVTGFVTYLYQ